MKEMTDDFEELLAEFEEFHVHCDKQEKISLDMLGQVER